ncbi:PC-esterase domain-containing protein 1A, partial [Sphaeramia orbicularis]|uniref:PC-esterase domain-containing protein 1A n=1 Tax=Sphaeramia orbicularis TaxID=375764 RepID=UPI00117D00C4
HFYLSLSQGEISFEQDCLVEGGSLDQMHNGTAYREVRQYQSNHHLVRFYFVTRIYSRYMQTIMQDFRSGLKPDILIINSCVWDISRYNSNWTKDYKENLHQFFNELKGTLPVESLVIWNLTMPVGKRIKGGFLVPEIEHRAPQIGYDVVEANFYSGTLANAYGMDVLDLHYQFRFLLHHRARDGVHWNAIAHRRVSTHLLLHTAQAWGVKMLSPLMSVGFRFIPLTLNLTKPLLFLYSPNTDDASTRQDFSSDSIPHGFMSFDMPLTYFQPQPKYTPATDDNYNYRPPHHYGHNPYVLKRRHTRRHYVPYTHHRHYNGHGHY